jgi:hypothetical protein
VSLVAAALLTTGCSDAVHVESPDPTGLAAAQCADLAAAAPASVAGAESREVEGPGVALVWGDPPITLRCGVPRPAGLQPGSRCDTVERVDWFTSRTEDGYRFATIGRATTVELFVPFDYDPAGDALVDVAAAVRQSVPVVERCL